MDRIIVSRHQATVEFIARELGGEVASAHNAFPASESTRTRMFVEIPRVGESNEEIPVLASATPDDVRGKVVYGDAETPYTIKRDAAEFHRVVRGVSPDACENCKNGVDSGYDHPECECLVFAPKTLY